jgi:hypothetical protein
MGFWKLGDACVLVSISERLLKFSSSRRRGPASMSYALRILLGLGGTSEEAKYHTIAIRLATMLQNLSCLRYI